MPSLRLAFLVYNIYMINVLFIDYFTLFSSNLKLNPYSVFALKDIVNKFDDLRIVCINTKHEMETFKYDDVLSELSQTLNLKKSLFFDDAKVDAYNDIGTAISKWMSSKEVKSFAIVTLGKNISVGKSYPNNHIFCDFGMFSEAQSKNAIWIMSQFSSNISKEDNVWFISDTHFGHANIIRYCNRPWNHGKDQNNEIIVTDDDVLAMDNEIIKRWNSVVGKNDIVWHLGDFALGGKEVAERIFPQLNGKINLVMGNHDHWKIKYYYDLGFHRVYDRKVIINDFVVLTHAPLQFLNNNCPFYQIFGHIHNSSVYQTWTKNSCCVCVERHDYYPVSWKTIKEQFDKMNNSIEGE